MAGRFWEKGAPDNRHVLDKSDHLLHQTEKFVESGHIDTVHPYSLCVYALFEFVFRVNLNLAL